MNAEQLLEKRRREETQEAMWKYLAQQDAKRAARTSFRSSYGGSFRRY